MPPKGLGRKWFSRLEAAAFAEVDPMQAASRCNHPHEYQGCSQLLGFVGISTPGIRRNSARNLPQNPVHHVKKLHRPPRLQSTLGASEQREPFSAAFPPSTPLPTLSTPLVARELLQKQAYEFLHTLEVHDGKIKRLEQENHEECQV